MSGQILLGIIVTLPLILGIVFRVSNSHLFFSLMAGELLGRYFGHDVEHHAHNINTAVNITGYGEIALLTLPLFLTAVILKGSISKGKLIVQALPLLVTGILFAAFLAPALPENLSQSIQAFTVGEWFLSINKLIVGGMVAAQLITLWLLNRGRGDGAVA